MGIPEFKPWPKTPRLHRPVTITEKIDGTNAAVIIDKHTFGEGVDAPSELIRIVFGSEVDDVGEPVFEYWVGAQSRKRLITPDNDNYAFAAWVRDNAPALVETLGEGYHFGEWWGAGIQRRYGLAHKRFSLFNTRRFTADLPALQAVPGLGVVPVLYEGVFSSSCVDTVVADLKARGSQAAPGFDRPEGICIFFPDAGQVFKVLLENDDVPKSAVA